MKRHIHVHTAEASLRHYWSMFNGTKKDFSEVESQFELTFHEQFTHIFQDGRILTREETKQHHTNHLAKGSIISIIHFKVVSPDYADVQFSVKNDEECQVFRVLFTIKDNKLLKAQLVDVDTVMQ